MFDRIVFLPDEFIDCGEQVVVPHQTRLWGRDGIEVQARAVYVATLRDHRIAGFCLYRTRPEALKAMGLEE